MKIYRLILTASLVGALMVSTAAFAKPEPRRHESHCIEQSAKVPSKHVVKTKAPAKPAYAKHGPHNKPIAVRKVSHISSKENDIIAIAAALLKLCS